MTLPAFIRTSSPILITVFTFLMLFNVPAQAQTFIEPTTPFGGVTASPINTSGTAQRKTGSLLIGTSSTSSYICLNADANPEDDAQGYPKCITSWSGIGADYVIVHTGATNPPQTGPTPSAPVPPVAPEQSGYARIKGTSSQAYSIIAEAANASGSTAIWAKEGLVAGSFAGYFEGRLYIGDGLPTSSKELCLNDTDTDLADGKGCITDWNDIANIAQVGPYVYLQPAPGPTTVQVGGEALTGAGVFQQSVVLGVPESGTNLCRTCGDGICSSGENSTNCPISGPPPVGTSPTGCPAGQVPKGDC